MNEIDDTWTKLPWMDIYKNRACAVAISDTTVAHIGGEPKRLSCPTECSEDMNIGKRINTYNVQNNVFVNGIQKNGGIVEMDFDRKMFGCALIPEGKNGHPTVAICEHILLNHQQNIYSNIIGKKYELNPHFFFF